MLARWRLAISKRVDVAANANCGDLTVSAEHGLEGRLQLPPASLSLGHLTPVAYAARLAAYAPAAKRYFHKGWFRNLRQVTATAVLSFVCIS